MNKDIVKRLEALEAAQSGLSAVALMTLLDDGTWDLTCSLWDGKNAPRRVQSHHQTKEEAAAAFDFLFRKHKLGQEDVVLIIDDL